MQPLAEFAALMAGDEPPLDRSLAVLAAVVRPSVNVEAVLEQFDAVAAACQGTDADSLCAELFGPAGFSPNRSDYYSPANSLIDLVLERRTGIPITLAAVAIEVGRRNGVGLVGIGMPGHFLLRSASDSTRFYDTFDLGRPLDRAGCCRRCAELGGPDIQLLDAHLEPVGSRVIMGRVLNNLQVAASQSGDVSVAAMVQRIRVMLSGVTLN